MDQAFQLMRAYARGNNRRLSDVAARIIDKSLGNVLPGKGRRAQPDKT